MFICIFHKYRVPHASPETGSNTLNNQWQVTCEPPVILVKIYFSICFLTFGLMAIRPIHVALSRELKRVK